MNTKIAEKIGNRWSRKLILAFLMVILLTVAPVLMGMGDGMVLDDISLSDSLPEDYSANVDYNGIIRKTNLSLVEHAISRLGTGYVYGTYGHIVNDSLLSAKLEQYPLKVKPYLDFIRSEWLGKPAQDCVGLIKGHYWTNDDGKIVYKLDGLPDVSANGLYKAAKETGPISTLPEIKGIIVWKSGHVGIYIGNGEVIEAHGTKSGVIKTLLTESINDTKWTNWFKCPYIEYLVESTESIESIGLVDSTDYTVQSGDTLWKIASKLLGKGILCLEIAKLNNINDTYTIFPGQILEIPLK